MGFLQVKASSDNTIYKMFQSCYKYNQRLRTVKNYVQMAGNLSNKVGHRVNTKQIITTNTTPNMIQRAATTKDTKVRDTP